MNVVHVTHEAVEKVGGIGAVIAGLMNADAYAEHVRRTVLLGPLLQADGSPARRLADGGEVIYSSLDGIAPDEWRSRFQAIERAYDVGIVYGTRKVSDPCTAKSVEAEVILVDVFHSNRERLNVFKAELYKKFAVPSSRFEDVWEYEEYVRLAEPGFEALKAIDCDGSGSRLVLLSHEYMGMPLALKAVLAGEGNTRTVFYAHEVASVRPIVEKSPGHDTMFYNVLRQASENGRTLDELFPQVNDNFKHPLVKAARYCDHVFAVGDWVQSEMRLLDPHFRTMDIDLVYNGIPAGSLELEAKNASRERLKDYAEALLGMRPTWVFTRVARPVLSKGIWRDVGVCHQLERLLGERGETAVYFMLGTLAGQRRPQDILQMERVYGWPVAHEEGYPDLCGGEEVVGANFEDFNRNHEAIRTVFVNQWDWNRNSCGLRMPEEMQFADIRRGSDVEFGLSVYEPFGISQFEALSTGAVCVVSNVCGSVGFARKAAEDQGVQYDDLVVEADYLNLERPMDVAELKGMSMDHRVRLEDAEAERVAGEVDRRLPRDEEQMRELISKGHRLATGMSWEHVVTEYFLPSLGRVVS